MKRDHTARSVIVALFLLVPIVAQSTPIGFEETYALAPDRAKAVATLIPGTEDFYYYSCRERLDARDFAAVRKILPVWIQRYGRSDRVVEIENRDALLSYAADPAAAFEFLRKRLGLAFDHQRVVPGQSSELPTRLDAEILSHARLTRLALDRHPATVRGFTNRALGALAQTALDDNRLHDLLGRLRRPDVENLPALVVRNLDHRQSQGFGSLPIHGELRREQLEECLRLRPALLSEPRFVSAFLVRLAPGADTNWRLDPAARAAHLARLWEFAQRLPPSFNSLKAHVLHHYLADDLSRGAPDRDRFLAYIRLPRRGGHVAEGHLRRHQVSEEFVDTNADFPTGLDAVSDDEALVRACLEILFATEDGYAPYADYLSADWLKVVLAETKILLGQGDMERWYSMIDDPAHLDRLESRVDLDFARTSRAQFVADEAVKLDVHVKNVPTLLVKVFAIDGFRYHVDRQSAVDASIDLDGVVPNFEQTFTYAEPPLRRVLRTYDLPRVRTPGTYVVEFVGNGISSRAVIHKGALRAVERVTAAGHLFRVYDEGGVHQKGAAIWFGGRDYAADTNGDILLPFSTSPGVRTVVLHEGQRSALASFDHRAEVYTFVSHAHVDRESLVAGRKARIVVRAQLRLGDRPVALALLTAPVLTIIATDQDGQETIQTVRDVVLDDGRELVHEISVPERLAALRVALAGRVKDLAGKDVDLSSSGDAFQVNGVDATAATSGVVLVQTAAGYVFEVRGKDGELKVGHACRVRLRHRDYTDPVEVALQTDGAGRIDLGALAGVTSVDVRLNHGFEGTFTLLGGRTDLPTVVHGLQGETLRVPYHGTARTASRTEFSLLGSDRDEFDKLALVDGFLEMRGLDPGDHVLGLHEAEVEITVRITRGVRDGAWLVGRDRILEASDARPLHVRPLQIEGEEALVRVANASGATRVHVVATRFVPPFDAFADLLGVPAAPDLATQTGRAQSAYFSGRQLGDEYRYVLERRFATKYPGNMLKRPTLLLNPWAIVDESKNVVFEARGGGAGGGTSGGRSEKAGRGAPGGAEAVLPNPCAHMNLDYLPSGSVLLANLAPDANGVVRVKLADLGEGHVVHAVAIDGEHTASASLVREEEKLVPRARHLAAALDGSKHLVEHRKIEFIAPGGVAVLDDARAARVEVYDSLASVHRLLSTICRDEALQKFAFVLDWPKLAPEKKRELHGQHACHELHFFLHRKDPEFFAAVVRPYLANKLDKTFLDRWLLGEDLAGFLEITRFERLNLIEKILLAQRIGPPGDGAIARFVREALELRPVNPERWEGLFLLALHGQGLDRDKGALAATFGASEESAPALRPAPPGESHKRADLKAQDEEQKDRAVDDLPGKEEVGDARRALAEDLRKRGMVARLYRAIEPTQVLAEHNYWRRRLDQMTADVIPPNRFWAEYATARKEAPFVSAWVAEASGNFLEAMFALSVLDLPFLAGKHEVAADGNRRTLKAATPLLLVRKEIKEAEKAADQAPILLGENFFRLDDRYRHENGERRDAFVTGEFLVDVGYGCQVVVTNPTSSKRAVEVLMQVPKGALPLNRGFWTKGVSVELQPYGTATLEYAFYFSAPGDFAHYPAHASEKGRLAAAAAPAVLKVVATPSRVDTASWEHVSQLGSPAEVLAHLDGANAQRLDLTKVAWRMRERDFFASFLARLRARHVFEPTLWSYAIFHRDEAASREYLEHAHDFLRACGAVLTTPLLAIDPKERREFQHLEFDPLVHARAHRLSGRRTIGNAELARQYAAFLRILGYHEKLDDADWLGVTYYLLLQDRVEEALATFAKVDAAKLPSRLQYDYVAAYTGFFTGDVVGARRTAERYRDYPVARWRERFSDVLNQLDEAEGKARAAGGIPSGDDLAAMAPALEISIEGRRARIAYRNVAQCEVRYYALDIEFAFSAQPFASDGGTSAAFVQPKLIESKDLAKDRTELVFDLPESLATKNVLVEVRGAGLVRSKTHLANALDVRFVESWGQVAVSEMGGTKPLPAVYVKVFARLGDGAVRFHKDGYTDLRGRFDYASVSDDPNVAATRFAVLVLSNQRGAVIREVVPPSQ